MMESWYVNSCTGEINRLGIRMSRKTWQLNLFMDGILDPTLKYWQGKMFHWNLLYDLSADEINTKNYCKSYQGGSTWGYLRPPNKLAPYKGVIFHIRVYIILKFIVFVYNVLVVLCEHQDTRRLEEGCTLVLPRHEGKWLERTWRVNNKLSAPCQLPTPTDIYFLGIVLQLK